MPSRTTNYNLYKPDLGQTDPEWGTGLNQNFDTIDSELKNAEDHRNITSGNPHGVDFIELDDTPSDYVGRGGEIVLIKSTEDGLDTQPWPTTGVNLNYFLSDDAADIDGYYYMHSVETGGASTQFTSSTLGAGDNQLLWTFVTEVGEPGTNVLALGVYSVTLYLQKSGNKDARVYWKLFKRDVNGNETELLQSVLSDLLTGSNSQYVISAYLNEDQVLDPTDRLVLKLYANVFGNGSNVIITLTMEGDYDSRILINILSSSFSLDRLSDVDVSTPTSDELLAYDSDSGKWINKTLSDIGTAEHGNEAHRLDLLIQVDTIPDLLDIDISSLPDGTQVSVAGYHTSGDGGGGIFYWDANEDKANHNGGTIIDPTRPFPDDWSNSSQVDSWFTAGTGTGCWKRVYNGVVDAQWFGAKSDATVDFGNILQHICDAFADGVTIRITDVFYISSDVTVPNDICLKFVKGGELNVNSGYTVTINGCIEAGCYRLFSGDGDIQFGSTSQNVVYADWFYSGDWGEAVNAALSSLWRGRVVVFPGNYQTGTTIILDKADVELEMREGCIWEYTGTEEAIRLGMNWSNGKLIFHRIRTNGDAKYGIRDLGCYNCDIVGNFIGDQGDTSKCFTDVCVFLDPSERSNIRGNSRWWINELFGGNRTQYGLKCSSGEGKIEGVTFYVNVIFQMTTTALLVGDSDVYDSVRYNTFIVGFDGTFYTPTLLDVYNSKNVFIITGATSSIGMWDFIIRSCCGKNVIVCANISDMRIRNDSSTTQIVGRETSLTFDGIEYYTNFDSIDSFWQSTSGSASIDWDSQGRFLSLSTGATNGSVAFLAKGIQYSLNEASFDKARKFRTKVHFTSDTDQEIYIVSGLNGTEKHVGFKIVNGTIYGSVADGTTENNLSLETINIANDYLLECIFQPQGPSSRGAECRFYINGVYKGALQDNLPSGSGNPAYFVLCLRIENSADAGKELRISEFKMIQSGNY